MNTAYENFREHLEPAIRQLKEIKQSRKRLEVEDLYKLETQINDLITELDELINSKQ